MESRSHRGSAAILKIASSSGVALVLSVVLVACSKPKQEPYSPGADIDDSGEAELEWVDWPTEELVEVAVTVDGFSAETAAGRALGGSFVVLVPVERLNEVVGKQAALREVLRQAVVGSAFDRGTCPEGRWLLKADHSVFSRQTNLSALRLIVNFNQAVGADLVWGFRCDLD